MSGLRFASPVFRNLSEQLLADRTREACAVVYTHYNPEAHAWVATSVEIVPDWAYERRDRAAAILRPAFLVEVANRARSTNLSTVLVHTHPWAEGIPHFSPVDDSGEIELAEYFARRVPKGSHLALVVGPEGCRARRLGTDQSIGVWEVGEILTLHSELSDGTGIGDRHDRQVRAFGQLGQRIVQDLKIGVIGAGGTGSVVLQQLAHLGVNNFTVVDPDYVELTNINRLIGAGPSDVGKSKVVIAEKTIHQINPDARVTKIERDVVDSDVAPRLTALDFLFICTDSHASRAIVGQLAYQHLVPAIDMGVSITVKDTSVTHITGRVQMLSPGLTCLVCTGALDGEMIRREMLTPEQRVADPYVQGVHEPQPAVVSINSAMASLAVTMFLGAVTPVPASARFQYYDGIRGTVRLMSAAKAEDCIVCSQRGAQSKGISWCMPLRPVESKHE